MRLIRGLHNLTETLPGSVATIGNFDGLHLGHQYILDHVRRLATELQQPSVVMTFEPQPLEFFKPEKAPARLTSLREKAIQLERLGIDDLVCLHFDQSLAQLSAAYDELAGRLQDDSGDAIDWAQEDIENLGDWEYRIVSFDAMPAEAIEAELNALGNERWEVYWIEPSADGMRVYLKRPAVSYLSRVPLGAMLRMFGGGTQ